MILIGSKELKREDFKSEKAEKEACGYFFSVLLEKIFNQVIHKLQIKDDRSIVNSSPR